MIHSVFHLCMHLGCMAIKLYKCDFCGCLYLIFIYFNNCNTYTLYMYLNSIKIIVKTVG